MLLIELGVEQMNCWKWSEHQLKVKFNMNFERKPKHSVIHTVWTRTLSHVTVSPSRRRWLRAKTQLNPLVEVITW